jgi:F-type H+-transporting ATPase subunit b
MREKKNLTALSTKFGVSSYNDLKGKIAVIKEAREKRDNLLRSTEDARIALEAARFGYENAKQELTRVIIRWGEEPPTSALNDFLNRLENKVSAFLEKKRMLDDVKNEVSGMAVEIAAAVIGREVSEKEHEQFIDDFIDKLGEE